MPRPGTLEEDSQGDVGRAALLEELRRAVKVDVRARGDRRRRLGFVTRPRELLKAPAKHALELGVDSGF